MSPKRTKAEHPPNFLHKETKTGWHFKIRQSRAGSRDWAWSTARIVTVVVLCIGFFAVPAGIFFLLQLLFAPLASSKLMWVPALLLQGLVILGFPILLRRWKLSQSDWLMVDLTRVALRIRGLEHRGRGQVQALDRTWPLHQLQDEQGLMIALGARRGSLLLGRGADQVRVAGLRFSQPEEAQVFLQHLSQAIEDAMERHGQGLAEIPDDLGRVQERAKEPTG